jgi:hypothetical protein
VAVADTAVFILPRPGRGGIAVGFSGSDAVSPKVAISLREMKPPHAEREGYFP